MNLTVTRRIEPENNEFKIVFLSDGVNAQRLELTWLADHREAYNLGDNESHLAFYTDDYNAAYTKHKKMGCICHENPSMKLYFINDPDGYWIEILSEY